MTNANIESALGRLATAQRILAMDGHNDLTLGHMSIRDPDGRGLWIKKAGKGISEIYDISDFALIDWSGGLIEGSGSLHSEWHIHAQVLLHRPDVNVVGHTHAQYSVLFSATEEELVALNHEGANLAGRVSRFNRTAGLINTKELGIELARILDDNPVCLLKNHGIVFVGSTIEAATLNGLFLERAAKMQLTMASTGLKWSAPIATGHDRSMAANPATEQGYHTTFFEFFVRTLARYEAAGHQH